MVKNRRIPSCRAHKLTNDLEKRYCFFLMLPKCLFSLEPESLYVSALKVSSIATK